MSNNNVHGVSIQMDQFVKSSRRLCHSFNMLSCANAFMAILTNEIYNKVSDMNTLVDS